MIQVVIFKDYPTPLLTLISSIQERDIEDEIIVEHDESSDVVPAAAASSSYQPVMGLKMKVQLIRGEKELMDALLLDANGMGELDGRSRIWVEQLRGISLEAQFVLNKYDAKLNHKPILIYICKYWTRHVVSKKIDGIRNKIEDASRRRKAYGLVQIQSRVVSKIQKLRARMQPYLAAKKSSVVGFDDDTQVLMTELLSYEKCRCITWIVGVGGTGKTTLANLMFEDNIVVAHFQRRVWVSLPSNCTTNQFVAKIGKETAKKITVEEENMPTDYVLTTLAHSKYLIVVDGLKETSKVYLDTLNRVIPDMLTGSRVLFTTRNATVAKHAAELIKVGKEIVMKCGGLPSQILKISDFLSHKDVTHEEWLSVLGGQQLNENQIQCWSETLDTINTNLPYYLRRCLFYFVLFPAEFGIPVRRLVVLWVAESLIHQAEDDEVPPELVAERYLTELIDRSMVQVAKRKRNGKVKTCRLPSALRADPKRFIIRRVADHLDKNDIWNDHIHGDNADSTSFQSYYKDVLSFHSFDSQEGIKPGKQVGNFLKGCISSDCFLLLLVLDLERVYKPNLPKRISRLTRLSYMHVLDIVFYDEYEGFTETYKLESLHSLPVHVENTSGQRHDINIGCEELLASTIFYLQLLPGINQELLPSVVSALCLLTFGASNLQVGRTILLQDYNTIISSNSLRVQCPLEANPDWRWSFYQPRKDQSLEFTGTGTENMAEYHACQTLLVVVANVLGGKKLESACLSPLDVEISSLIKWERSLLRN
ncbi:unnamed protein product [Vicia faba]|uniref:Uncharacterized protein n=1 Tax=Vicia faba TaxID=3906 RepID=A0AAV0Z9D0_VICFA|nr:unnamed protein product [Vicia faba]